MPFANEFVSPDKLKPYALDDLCAEHHLAPIEDWPFIEEWTIDRERNAFLIQVRKSQKSGYCGYAFHWRGSWSFFEMCATASRIDSLKRSMWFRFRVRGLSILSDAVLQEELIEDLKAAITAWPGGVPLNFLDHSATIELVD